MSPMYGNETGTVEQGLVSGAEFRAACGLFPTGVTVVTRRLNSGRPYGMTVSSFTSVSLEPPLILVCIDRRAGFSPGLTPGIAFAVNMLSEHQQELSVHFSKPPESDRFGAVAWREGWGGVPILNGIVASLACEVDRVQEAGDHFIVVGAVREIKRFGGRPLVWCESGYHCLPPPREGDRLL